MLDIGPRQIELLISSYRNPQERLEDEVRTHLTTFPERAAAEMLERGLDQNARQELRCYWEAQKLAGGIEAFKQLAAKVETGRAGDVNRSDLDCALQAVLRDLLAQGAFMALNQILSAGIVPPAIRTSRELQEMARFVFADQIALGRADFIKEAADRLVPDFCGGREYRAALAEGVRRLLDEQRYAELPYFIEVYPHAGRALLKLAGDAQIADSLAQALPYALPEDMGVMAPIQRALKGAAFQARLEVYIRGCTERGEIRNLILAGSNFPLGLELKQRVRHAVARTVTTAVEAALYYFGAEGQEFVNHFHRYVEFKALALRAASLYGLPDSVTAALRQSAESVIPQKRVAAVPASQTEAA